MNDTILPEDPNIYLHDWVFHYNTFSGAWAAIPRELYQAYWSDYNLKGVLRSTEINTLLTIIYRTKGDPEAMEKLTTTDT